VTSHSAALALWRGRALVEFTYDEFAQAEAGRLEELRLVAIEELADAELASGRHANAVGRLQALVDEHPLRERLWGSLMLALYRCGRQAEALRAYQSLRRILDEELAIEPSRTIQRLEEAILLQSTELDLVQPAETATFGDVPLPSRLTAERERGHFVGRAQQMGRLGAALDEVRECRRRGAVLIAGEPGIGKTTLVSEFARTVHGKSAVVVYGRCDEGAGMAYAPWAAALDHLINHPASWRVSEVAADHGADLAHLGPDLQRLAAGGGGGSIDPELARHQLFGAVLRVLDAASQDRPVVVILDDLHWADTPSLTLLRRVLGTDRALAVLIVGTFRDSDIAANAALADMLAALRRESGVARLKVTGLDATELHALVEAETGGPITGEMTALRDAVARETSGNPFFASELIRHAVETGFVRRAEDGSWLATGDLRDQGLPASLREVIGRRVARLGDDAIRVLSVAAVIGRDFDLTVVSAASGTDHETLLDILDAAVAASLVINVDGERFSFVHALVQHALYDALNPARRARAHRRAAEALEATVGAHTALRAGELATHHVRAGSAGDRAKAVRYAVQAGDHALAQLAPDEALRWYDQAVALLDQGAPLDDHLRARLLVGLGDAQRQTGDAAFRATLGEAGRLAERIGDSDTLVAAILADNRGTLTRRGVFDKEQVVAIEAALSAIPTRDSPLRARLLSLLAIELIDSGDGLRRLAVADEALAMARRLADPAVLLDVLLRRHNAIRMPDTLTRRLDETAEALDLAAASGHPDARFSAVHNRMISVVEAGDFEAFLRCQDEVKSLAVAIDQPTPIWIETLSRCARVLLAGDAAGAEAVAAETLRLGRRTGQPDVETIHVVQLFLVRWHQGRSGELVETMARLTEAVPQLVSLRAALLGVLIDAGLWNRARVLLASERAAGFDRPHDYLWLPRACVLAECAVELGDLGSARELYEHLAPWHDQVSHVIFGVLGSTAHYLGALATALARFEDAERYLASAESIHQRLQSPFHMARTHLAWARLLLARAGSNEGASADVRRRLSLARDLAERFDCAGVRRQVDDLSRSACKPK